VPQPVRRARHVFDRSCVLGEERRQPRQRDLQRQLFLAVVVLVQRRDRDAGLGGDVADLGRRQPLAGEDAQGRLLDLLVAPLAAVLLALAASRVTARDGRAQEQ
jgi:hypothetical protein